MSIDVLYTMPVTKTPKDFNRQKKELFQVIMGIRDAKLLEEFLSDLLTPQEYIEVVTRWQLVKQLHAGIPQRAIAKKLKISIAKITRGSRMLLNASGGFNKILKKEKN